MSESKHTPGPWRLDGVDVLAQYGPHLHVFVHDHSRTIAANIERPEAEANARLIAAAPDMLAALIDCAESLAAARDKLGTCGEGDGKDRKADADDTIGSLSALNTARAAIAKAEGRT